MNQAGETPVILLGVPLDFEEFTVRVDESDWLGKFRDESNPAARQQRLESTWHAEYLPLVARPLLELVKASAAFGVPVQRRATLASLHKATSERSVVVLFAHWKGPEISNDDFIEPIDGNSFLQRASGETTTLGKWLANRLQGLIADKTNWRAKLFSLFRSSGYQSLRGALGEALEADFDEDEPGDVVDEIVEHPVTRAARRRDALDSLLRGLIRPGNRLELFDGLHSKETVETTIAKDFEGVIDLTTCTSTYLADYVAAKREFRLRTIQFPTVQDVVWGANCVIAALELRAAAGIPYQEARSIAARQLEQAVREIPKLAR